MWPLVLSLTLPHMAAAAPDLDTGRFTLDVTNDLFGTGLDEGYSSGIRLAVRVSPFIKDGLTGALPRRWQDSILAEYWSLGFQWDMYTPFDLEADSVEALQNDRPYAGYMGGILGAEFLTRAAIEPGGYTLWSFALESGLVGPSTKTGQVQRAWHRGIRDLLNRNFTPRDPNGWGIYEVPDAFMIWIRTRVESEFMRQPLGLRPRDFIHGNRPGVRASAFVDCDLGNRRVGCDGGFTLRLGYLPDVAMEGLFPVNTWDPARQGERPRHPLYAYLFTAVAADITLFDAFLDGPIGIDSPTKNKRELGGEGQIGFVFRWKRVELFYRHVVLTREIEELPPEAVHVQQLGQLMFSLGW